MTASEAGPAEMTDRALLALLRTSLAVWGGDATVARTDRGFIEIATVPVVIEIARAPPELPFRWVLRIGSRERAASSVTGLLRILRGTLDPEWRPGRARIAALTPPAGTP